MIVRLASRLSERGFMQRKLVGSVVALALVAVSCGQSASPETTSTSTVSTATTDTPSTTTTLATAGSTTTATTTEADSTTSTAAPTVVCGNIDAAAGGAVATVTYSQDGYLWNVGIDATECLADLPARLASMGYTWGPAGDKVLFADGSILGSGIERGPIGDIAASLGWTRPTGTSTIHVAFNGTLTKATSETVFGESRLQPIINHDAVAYHPDGTTFAVSGTGEIDQGIWISKNDGSEAQLLAFADSGVIVPEIVFTNDALWLIAIADHTNDDFDDGYHLHSVSTEPFEMDDGTVALGSGTEFGANTHLVSRVPLDSIVVPVGGSGFGDVPNGLAVAQGECGPERRAIYLPDGNISDEPVALSDRPSYPVGFLSSDDGHQRILVANSDDGCTGPFNWQVVDIDTADGTLTVGISGSGADTLAVHSTAPTVDITLSGVVIDPFA